MDEILITLLLYVNELSCVLKLTLNCRSEVGQNVNEKLIPKSTEPVDCDDELEAVSCS